MVQKGIPGNGKNDQGTLPINSSMLHTPNWMLGLTTLRSKAGEIMLA
jgi:hypothetical protein